MALTRTEERRATQLEEIAAKRDLTPAEMEEYHNLALASHRRVLMARANIEALEALKAIKH